MKKIVFYAAFVTFFVASCAKQETTVQMPQEQGFSLCASIEDLDTKTSHTLARSLVWAAGDQIAVYADDGTFKTLSINPSDVGKNTATFIAEAGFTPNTNFVAVYPAAYATSVSIDNVSSVDRTQVHVTLPASYTWQDDNAVDGRMRINAPMLGKLDGEGKIVFKQVVGFIKFDVEGIPSDANKLVFTAYNNIINGDFGTPIDVELDSFWPGLWTWNNAGTEDWEISRRSVTVSFPAGVSKRTFYVPIPASGADGYNKGEQSHVFSVAIQKDDEAAVETKYRTSSFAVATGSLFVMPAFACSSVSTVLWEGTHAYTTEWTNWDAVPARAITGIWSTFSAGDVLRFHVSDVTNDGYIKLSYKKKADWSWDTVTEGSVPEAASVYDVTLTDEQLSNLSIHDYLVVSGKNMTITKIEVLDNKPETVLWTGSKTFGSDDTWDDSTYVTDLNNPSYWSSVSAGKILTVYYNEIDQTATWRHLRLAYPASPWVDMNTKNGHNADGTSFFSYKLSADDATGLKTHGLVVYGTGLTITKITLR